MLCIIYAILEGLNSDVYVKTAYYKTKKTSSTIAKANAALGAGEKATLARPRRLRLLNLTLRQSKPKPKPIRYNKGPRTYTLWTGTRFSVTCSTRCFVLAELHPWL